MKLPICFTTASLAIFIFFNGGCNRESQSNNSKKLTYWDTMSRVFCEKQYSDTLNRNLKINFFARRNFSLKNTHDDSIRIENRDDTIIPPFRYHKLMIYYKNDVVDKFYYRIINDSMYYVDSKNKFIEQLFADFNRTDSILSDHDVAVPLDLMDAYSGYQIYFTSQLRRSNYKIKVYSRIPMTYFMLDPGNNADNGPRPIYYFFSTSFGLVGVVIAINSQAILFN